VVLCLLRVQEVTGSCPPPAAAGSTIYIVPVPVPVMLLQSPWRSKSICPSPTCSPVTVRRGPSGTMSAAPRVLLPQATGSQRGEGKHWHWDYGGGGVPGSSQERHFNLQWALGTGTASGQEVVTVQPLQPRHNTHSAHPSNTTGSEANLCACKGANKQEALGVQHAVQRNAVNPPLSPALSKQVAIEEPCQCSCLYTGTLRTPSTTASSKSLKGGPAEEAV
jgi:hypothetical protein